MNKHDREAFIREQKEKSSPTAAPPDADLAFTQEQYAAFLSEAKRINDEDSELLHPDSLRKLTADGYEFRNEVGARIIRDGAADVVAYLQSKRGQAARCDLLNVIHSKSKSLEVYERIKGEVRRNGLYQKPVFVRSENDKTDEYLIDRRRDFMHGIRRQPR